jgi:hypothetical protein
MKRVKLTWSRNTGEEVKAYRVFRATHPKVTRKDMLIMEVEHSVVPKPVHITDDKLTKHPEYGYYVSKYKSIMPDEENYPIQITVNGMTLDSLGLSTYVDYEDGIFAISTTLNDYDDVRASYYIDGIQVFDTSEVEQPGVTYMGPIARDRTDSSVPQNLSLIADHDNGRVFMTWDPANTPGQTYYYRVEAIDAFGNFSELSLQSSVHLHEGLAYEGYLVERSFDGTNWGLVSTQGAADYIEYGVDRLAPDAPTSVTGVATPQLGLSVANIDITWTASSEGLASPSGMYRVSSVSALGDVSKPSVVVGPVYLKSIVKQYVVRRKINDGSIPSFDGNDAITVAITDNAVTNFLDYHVPHNTEYIYAIYAVDAAENVSMAGTTIVTVGDAA